MRATTNETAEEKENCSSKRLQKPVRRNEKYKKSVDTILWREGSDKIERSETESSVSMQGTCLYRQSFEESLQSDTGTGWMTGSCTAKNRRTDWVLRGCRGMGWKTWGRKKIYCRTNTDKDKVHGKTKTVARIESIKTAGRLLLMHWRVVLCKISRNEKAFFTTVSNTEMCVEKRGDSQVFFNKLWCVLKP